MKKQTWLGRCKGSPNNKKEDTRDSQLLPIPMQLAFATRQPDSVNVFQKILTRIGKSVSIQNEQETQRGRSKKERRYHHFAPTTPSSPQQTALVTENPRLTDDVIPPIRWSQKLVYDYKSVYDVKPVEAFGPSHEKSCGLSPKYVNIYYVRTDNYVAAGNPTLNDHWCPTANF